MTRRTLLTAFLAVAVSADVRDGRAKPPDEQSERRKAAEQLIDSFELESLQGETWAKAKRIDRPLLLYTDDTRAKDVQGYHYLRGKAVHVAPDGRTSVLAEGLRFPTGWATRSGR